MPTHDETRNPHRRIYRAGEANAWNALADASIDSWQDALGFIACQLWEVSPAERATQALYEPILDRLREIPGHLWCDVDFYVGRLLGAALTVGVVGGYALGRTWPTDFRDFDRWLQTAIETSGLESYTPPGVRS